MGGFVPNLILTPGAPVKGSLAFCSGVFFFYSISPGDIKDSKNVAVATLQAVVDIPIE